MISSKWLVVIPSFLFSLAVMLPLSGLLVRWRAHFSPKRVRSEGSGEELAQQEAMQSPVMGYFAISRRVYNVEGIKGFYKGIGPHLTSLIVGAVLTHLIIPSPLFNESRPPPRKAGDSIFFSNPDVHPLSHVSYWILHLAIDIPTQIIMNRAIATPYMLSFTSPLKSLSLLLSPSELQNPTNLYLIPGISLTRFLLVFSWIALDPIFGMLIPAHDPSQDQKRGIIPFFVLTPFFVFTVLNSIIKTPLMVASVRLSLQRFDKGNTTETEGSNTTLERYSTDDVVTLKDISRHPYTGLVDCLNTIVKEEGWKTLFRSGWLTFLGI